MRRSLLELLDEHDELVELFFLHQECLLNFDLAGARARLETYVHRLRAHMCLEEHVVLPAYELLGPTARGAGTELFRAEHDKIEWWLRRLPGLLDPLEGGRELTFRDVVPILERQCTFKHLLEHHDHRERVHLYPTLERELSAGASSRLLEEIARLEQPGSGAEPGDVGVARAHAGPGTARPQSSAGRAPATRDADSQTPSPGRHRSVI